MYALLLFIRYCSFRKLLKLNIPFNLPGAPELICPSNEHGEHHSQLVLRQ